MSPIQLDAPPRRRTGGRAASQPADSPPEASERPRLRLPSLTGLLVRALVLCFTLVVLWRLALLAFETYETARYTRPPVQTLSAPTAVPPPTDAGVEALLREAGLPGGVVAAYVRNLSTGVGGRVNADRRFHAASLYKLPVMVEVFKQQRLKRFAFDDQLTIEARHWTDGSGVLQARVGDSLTIGELLRRMIAESDNIAANRLVDLVGPENVNETMLALGLKNTRVVDPFRENAAPTTSAEDIGRLLELIATGRMVDADASERAIQLMESKQAQEWLAEGLPWWGKLAHKWGDVPNSRHDAGIVFTPRNQIVLVVLTENGGPARAAEQIRSISRQTVSYFEGPGP